MLKKNRKSTAKASGESFAIVASKYNRKYVDGMLKAAKAELNAASAESIKVVRVPGAFEIPAVAAALAESDSPSYGAIICLGVILQGETTHADHIGEAVTHALADIQVFSSKPVIHEVLQFSNEDQAKVRCLSKDRNRGTEAAQTAVEMAGVMRRLR